ncbi:MAG: extracellular solute-binding protein [Oscillochloris sp.]|nr:extracellular solute-binding protein [Oscillochloris sp.]
MRSRSLRVLATLLLIAPILAACGTASETSPTTAPATGAEPAGEVQASPVAGAVACERPLEFWPALSGAELDFVRQQIPNFEAQTGLTVEILDVPFDNLQQQFIQATPAGEGPDLLYGLNDWTGVLAEGGFIADLTDQIDSSQYLENPLQSVTYQDRIWAVPESYEVVTQYYNPDVLPEGAESLDGLQTTQLDTAEYALAFDITNFYFAAPFLYAVGGQLFDDQGNFVLTEEAATTWLTELRDLQQQAQFPAEVTGEAARALFLGGNAGSYYSGPWDVAEVRNAEFDWQLAPLPSVNGQPAQPFLGTKALFVSSQSDCQEAALELARFITGQETQLAWINEVNPAHLPAIQSIYDVGEIADNQIIQGFRQQAEQSVPLPNIPELGQVWTPAADALSNVLNAGVAPEEAAAQLVETIQSNIEAQQ